MDKTNFCLHSFSCLRKIINLHKHSFISVSKQSQSFISFLALYVRCTHLLKIGDRNEHATTMTTRDVSIRYPCTRVIENAVTATLRHCWNSQLYRFLVHSMARENISTLTTNNFCTCTYSLYCMCYVEHFAISLVLQQGTITIIG